MKKKTPTSRLSRLELLDLLMIEKQKNEELTKRLEDAERKLEEQELICQKNGNLADAAAEISGVLMAAQKAADLYLENVKRNHEENENRSS